MASVSYLIGYMNSGNVILNFAYTMLVVFAAIVVETVHDADFSLSMITVKMAFKKVTISCLYVS